MRTALTEQQQSESSNRSRTARTNRLLTVAVVVLALGLIGVGIWAMWERSRSEDLSADLTASEAEVATLEGELATYSTTVGDLRAELEAATGLIVLGGEPITERQQEMVDLAFLWMDAYRAGDGDLMASYATDDAYVDYASPNWATLWVEDGSLQARVAVEDFETMELSDTALVYNDTVVLAGSYEARSLDFIYVLEFTLFGDVKVESGYIIFA